MKAPVLSRVAALAVLLLVQAACGDAASPTPTAAAVTAAPTATPTVAPVTASPQANAITWTVDPSSKATIKVREQLVRLPSPIDALINITGAQGAFTLNPDGSFASSSKVSVDMTTVTSETSRCMA